MLFIVFNVSGTKLKCTKCAPSIANETRQWIAAAGWKAHIKSEIHQRAPAAEQDTQQRQMLIDQAAEAALAEENMTDFAYLNTSSSSAAPSIPKRIISANEEAMWESLAMDDVIFDAGTTPNNVDDRRRVEREMDHADNWGDDSGFGDDSHILYDLEDEMLAEVLQNAREWYAPCCFRFLIRCQSCKILTLLI